MVSTLGDIQSNLKLMNLLEYYLFILIVVFAILGVGSLLVAPKFVEARVDRIQVKDNLKSTIINGLDNEEKEIINEYLD